MRIRKAAVLKTPVKLHIHYRETNETSTKGPCPVCGSETLQIRNKTLFDEKVDLGFRCTKCPYWTGQLKRVPVRYIFNALIEQAPRPPRRKGQREILAVEVRLSDDYRYSMQGKI